MNDRFSEEVTQVLNRMLAGRLTPNLEQEKQNPKSLHFPRGFRYRYWELKLKTRKRRFCHSTRPNAAGCFLTWVETIVGSKGEREDIQAHDLRHEAKAYALRQYEKARAAAEVQP